MNLEKYQELRKKMEELKVKNNWSKYHTEKDLAMAISIEVSELMENYLWDSMKYSETNVKEEIADVYIYLLYLSEILDIDLVEVANLKMDKNIKRF